MAVPKEWLTFLREQFPEGSRIRLREHSDDALEPGSMGTLDHITDDAVFCTTWWDGQHVELKLGTDSFSVLPAKFQTLKLYMPITADIYEYDAHGDLADDPIELDGENLMGYGDRIIAALQKHREPEEGDRGIMHWYDWDTPLDVKVHSVFFSAEEREGRLWGVAECGVAGSLSYAELTDLKQYLCSHVSGDWGSIFEEQKIPLDNGEMYAHLWNIEDWSIQTEQERFGPKLAEGLPELCFSVLPSTGELICIKRGESGHYPADQNTPDAGENRKLADFYNERLGVTPAQRMAMETGSMHGWSVPGADPKAYEQTQPEQGGMTFA